MNRLFTTLLCLGLCLSCSLGFAQKTNNTKKPVKNATTAQAKPAKPAQAANVTKAKTVPATANANAEKPAKAHLKLSQNSIDFGTITIGKAKIVEVTFTNTGVKPLIITDTYTNCGCTSIEYPEEPFAPGKSGKLKITYDADEEGFFSKTITIYSNADNKKELIKIQGIVSKD